jgi:hypothetical protein
MVTRAQILLVSSLASNFGIDKYNLHEWEYSLHKSEFREFEKKWESC